MQKNLKAFLDMISFSEGTSELGDRGYNVIVGGLLFDSYADHPRARIYIKSIKNYSTVAGRYQILSKTFDAYKSLLGLKDFSPDSQDKIAIKLINERGAINDILNGKIESAIKKVKNIWASLPGAGYGQRENKLSSLLNYYKQAGGTIG